MIAAVRRKTRWHWSYVAWPRAAYRPGRSSTIGASMRAGLAARDAARAADGARSILYFMQTEVSRLMLARGLGMQETPQPVLVDSRRR